MLLSSTALGADIEVGGTKYHFDLPDGWKVTGQPSPTLVVIASSPNATRDNPFPVAGEAMILLDFHLQPGQTEKFLANSSDRLPGKPADKAKAVTKTKVGKRDADQVDINTATVAQKATMSVVDVDGKPVVAKLYDNGRADSCMVLGHILDSLVVTP